MDTNEPIADDPDVAAVLSGLSADSASPAAKGKGGKLTVGGAPSSTVDDSAVGEVRSQARASSHVACFARKPLRRAKTSRGVSHLVASGISHHKGAVLHAFCSLP